MYKRLRLVYYAYAVMSNNFIALLLWYSTELVLLPSATSASARCTSLLTTARATDTLTIANTATD